MQHKCKMTVIRKECYPDFQQQYLMEPQVGPCPFYHVGDEFLFERFGEEDTFWRMDTGSHCSEAWDCISRYIYTALQGGSIMRGWTKDQRVMIASCNDGTRPVIFKIERQDYKVLRITGMGCEGCPETVKAALEAVSGVERVEVYPEKRWAEVFVGLENIPTDVDLVHAVEAVGYEVEKVE